MIVYRCDGCNRTLSDEEAKKSFELFSEITKSQSNGEAFCRACLPLAASYWGTALPDLYQALALENVRRVANFRKDYFKKRPIKAVPVESQDATGSD